MASPPAPDFPALLAALSRELTTRRLPFMLIGGQAVLVHGRPRLTEDIDVTIGAPPDRLPDVRAVADTLGLEPLPPDVAAFVRDTFVLPVTDRRTGIRVDFIFSTTPYEQQAIGRALRIPVAGVAVPFASAEDLLIHKLFAGRALDWEDALSVVRRKGRQLDWSYLDRWAREFAMVPGRERMPELVRKLQTDAGC